MSRHTVVGLGRLALLVAAAGAISSALGAAKPGSPARLFYFDTAQAGRCLWQVHDVASNAKRQVFETKECPLDVLWDAASKKLYFYTSSKFVSWAWDPAGAKAVMSELPPLRGVADFWLDQKSGAPILAVYAEPEKVLESGDSVKLVFEGKTYSYDPEDALPPDGQPGMAVAYRLTGDQWQRVAVEPTRGSVGYPFGMMVLSNELGDRRDTVSLQQLLTSQTCATVDACGMSKLKLKPAVRKQLKKTFRFNADTDEQPSYEPLDKSSGLLFQLGMGDTLHRTLPAVLCQAGCSKQTKLEGLPGGEQFGVAVKGSFALVVCEYTGKDARIYRANSAKPLLSLPASQGAVWLPDGIF